MILAARSEDIVVTAHGQQWLFSPADALRLRNQLTELLNQPPPHTIDTIKQIVADHFGLPASALEGPSRPNRIARPRMAAMWLCCQCDSFTQQFIGDKFGGRDHGTVIHARNTVNNWIETDKNWAATMTHLARLVTERTGVALTGVV